MKRGIFLIAILLLVACGDDTKPVPPPPPVDNFPADPEGYWGDPVPFEVGHCVFLPDSCT